MSVWEKHMPGRADRGNRQDGCRGRLSWKVRKIAMSYQPEGSHEERLELANLAFIENPQLS
jgi:hypothetical protein